MTQKLPSHALFGGTNQVALIHRSWMKDSGLPDDAFDDCPVVGNCNTNSEFTPGKVFAYIDNLKARLDRPELEMNETSIMMHKNCGPKCYPGMAEVGNMPLTEKLLQKGARDKVRVSDARMFDTTFGTVVLHVTPEAAAGRPLVLVQNGDEITPDVQACKFELQRRQNVSAPQKRTYRGGHETLYVEHLLQSDTGADFDFLVGCGGAAVPFGSH